MNMIDGPRRLSPLLQIPPEVLEHIAFHAATHTVPGPPVDLVPLLLSARPIHAILAASVNAPLYARIFAHKFDTIAILRRLGHGVVLPPACALRDELRLRCASLARLRAAGATTGSLGPCGPHASNEQTREDLWRAYIMMLEDEGTNMRWLRQWAGLRGWLRTYWYRSIPSVQENWALSSVPDGWPRGGEQNALAMWLYWFLFDPNDLEKDEDMIPVLKVLAFAAHKYALAETPWDEFDLPPSNPPSSSSSKTASPLYLGTYDIAPTPLSGPAILAYLALLNLPRLRPSVLAYYADPGAPTISSGGGSREWDAEWARVVKPSAVARSDVRPLRVQGFRPGSLAGLWEGTFMYTEFNVYAALLMGAPPVILEHSRMAQHRQTWKLREYHLHTSLLAPAAAAPSHPSSLASASGASPMLDVGDPMHGFLPDGKTLDETPTGLVVRQDGVLSGPVVYTRYECGEGSEDERQVADDSSSVRNANGGGDSEVADIIIMGEGHSAWGQFSLRGRVRPSDGLIVLTKTYDHAIVMAPQVSGDRGRWIYRGYVVGDARGNFTGRWRDSLTPAAQTGYEGCFVMSRRG